MRLPPADAYLKIKHSLEEINLILHSAAYHLPEKDKEKYRVNLYQDFALTVRYHHY